MYIFIHIALLDQLNNLNRTSSQVVVIATTKCKEDLHPMLLQSRGCHVFSEILEIPPPDLVSFNDIHEQFLFRSPPDLKELM